MSVAEQNLTDRITYDDLYRRWEQNNWSATEIDLSRDRSGWAGLSQIQRDSAKWIYSMFFYGEDSVADNLSPYIDAAPKEEQKYFLATQQVDEARHAIFFHRFFKEVIGAGDDIATTLASTEKHLGWGYRKVFERLDRMAIELRRDARCRSSPRRITALPHDVEATMARPASPSSRTSSSGTGRCRASPRGWRTSPATTAPHASASSAQRAAPRVPTSARRPWMSSSRGHAMDVVGVHPPNWDREYTRCYGFELEDIGEWGMRAHRAESWKGRSTRSGDSPGDLPDGHVHLPPRTRSQLIRMTQAGVDRRARPSADSLTPRPSVLYFDF